MSTPNPNHELRQIIQTLVLHINTSFSQLIDSIHSAQSNPAVKPINQRQQLTPGPTHEPPQQREESRRRLFFHFFTNAQMLLARLLALIRVSRFAIAIQPKLNEVNTACEFYETTIRIPLHNRLALMSQQFSEVKEGLWDVNGAIKTVYAGGNFTLPRYFTPNVPNIPITLRKVVLHKKHRLISTFLAKITPQPLLSSLKFFLTQGVLVIFYPYQFCLIVEPFLPPNLHFYEKTSISAELQRVRWFVHKFTFVINTLPFRTLFAPGNATSANNTNSTQNTVIEHKPILISSEIPFSPTNIFIRRLNERLFAAEGLSTQNLTSSTSTSTSATTVSNAASFNPQTPQSSSDSPLSSILSTVSRFIHSFALDFIEASLLRQQSRQSIAQIATKSLLPDKPDKSSSNPTIPTVNTTGGGNRGRFGHFGEKHVLSYTSLKHKFIQINYLGQSPSNPRAQNIASQPAHDNALKDQNATINQTISQLHHYPCLTIAIQAYPGFPSQMNTRTNLLQLYKLTLTHTPPLPFFPPHLSLHHLDIQNCINFLKEYQSYIKTRAILASLSTYASLTHTLLQTPQLTRPTAIPSSSSTKRQEIELQTPFSSFFAPFLTNPSLLTTTLSSTTPKATITTAQTSYPISFSTFPAEKKKIIQTSLSQSSEGGQVQTQNSTTSTRDGSQSTTPQNMLLAPPPLIKHTKNSENLFSQLSVQKIIYLKQSTRALSLSTPRISVLSDAQMALGLFGITKQYESNNCTISPSLSPPFPSHPSLALISSAHTHPLALFCIQNPNNGDVYPIWWNNLLPTFLHQIHPNLASVASPARFNAHASLLHAVTNETTDPSEMDHLYYIPHSFPSNISKKLNTTMSDIIIPNTNSTSSNFPTNPVFAMNSIRLKSTDFHTAIADLNTFSALLTQFYSKHPAFDGFYSLADKNSAPSYQKLDQIISIPVFCLFSSLHSTLNATVYGVGREAHREGSAMSDNNDPKTTSPQALSNQLVITDLQTDPTFHQLMVVPTSPNFKSAKRDTSPATDKGVSPNTMRPARPPNTTVLTGGVNNTNTPQLNTPIFGAIADPSHSPLLSHSTPHSPHLPATSALSPAHYVTQQQQQLVQQASHPIKTYPISTLITNILDLLHTTLLSSTHSLLFINSTIVLSHTISLLKTCISSLTALASSPSSLPFDPPIFPPLLTNSFTYLMQPTKIQTNHFFALHPSAITYPALLPANTALFSPNLPNNPSQSPQTASPTPQLSTFNTELYYPAPNSSSVPIFDDFTLYIPISTQNSQNSQNVTKTQFPSHFDIYLVLPLTRLAPYAPSNADLAPEPLGRQSTQTSSTSNIGQSNPNSSANQSHIYPYYLLFTAKASNHVLFVVSLESLCSQQAHSCEQQEQPFITPQPAPTAATTKGKRGTHAQSAHQQTPTVELIRNPQTQPQSRSNHKLPRFSTLCRELSSQSNTVVPNTRLMTLWGELITTAQTAIMYITTLFFTPISSSRLTISPITLHPQINILSSYSRDPAQIASSQTEPTHCDYKLQPLSYILNIPSLTISTFNVHRTTNPASPFSITHTSTAPHIAVTQNLSIPSPTLSGPHRPSPLFTTLTINNAFPFSTLFSLLTEAESNFLDFSSLISPSHTSTAQHSPQSAYFSSLLTTFAVVSTLQPPTDVTDNNPDPSSFHRASDLYSTSFDLNSQHIAQQYQDLQQSSTQTPISPANLPLCSSLLNNEDYIHFALPRPDQFIQQQQKRHLHQTSTSLQFLHHSTRFGHNSLNSGFYAQYQYSTGSLTLITDSTLQTASSLSPSTSLLAYLSHLLQLSNYIQHLMFLNLQMVLQYPQFYPFPSNAPNSLEKLSLHALQPAMFLPHAVSLVRGVDIKLTPNPHTRLQSISSLYQSTPFPFPLSTKLVSPGRIMLEPAYTDIATLQGQIHQQISTSNSTQSQHATSSPPQSTLLTPVVSLTPNNLPIALAALWKTDHLSLLLPHSIQQASFYPSSPADYHQAWSAVVAPAIQSSLAPKKATANPKSSKGGQNEAQAASSSGRNGIDPTWTSEQEIELLTAVFEAFDEIVNDFQPQDHILTISFSSSPQLFQQLYTYTQGGAAMSSSLHSVAPPPSLQTQRSHPDLPHFSPKLDAALPPPLLPSPHFSTSSPINHPQQNPLSPPPLAITSQSPTLYSPQVPCYNLHEVITLASNTIPDYLISPLYSIPAHLSRNTFLPNLQPLLDPVFSPSPSPSPSPISTHSELNPFPTISTPSTTSTLCGHILAYFLARLATVLKIIPQCVIYDKICSLLPSTSLSNVHKGTAPWYLKSMQYQPYISPNHSKPAQLQSHHLRQPFFPAHSVHSVQSTQIPTLTLASPRNSGTQQGNTPKPPSLGGNLSIFNRLNPSNQLSLSSRIRPALPTSFYLAFERNLAVHTVPHSSTVALVPSISPLLHPTKYLPLLAIPFAASATHTHMSAQPSPYGTYRSAHSMSAGAPQKKSLQTQIPTTSSTSLPLLSSNLLTIESNTHLLPPQTQQSVQQLLINAEALSQHTQQEQLLQISQHNHNATRISSTNPSNATIAAQGQNAQIMLSMTSTSTGINNSTLSGLQTNQPHGTISQPTPQPTPQLPFSTTLVPADSTLLDHNTLSNTMISSTPLTNTALCSTLIDSRQTTPLQHNPLYISLTQLQLSQQLQQAYPNRPQSYQFATLSPFAPHILTQSLDLLLSSNLFTIPQPYLQQLLELLQVELVQLHSVPPANANNNTPQSRPLTTFFLNLASKGPIWTTFEGPQQVNPGKAQPDHTNKITLNIDFSSPLTSGPSLTAHGIMNTLTLPIVYNFDTKVTSIAEQWNLSAQTHAHYRSEYISHCKMYFAKSQSIAMRSLYNVYLIPHEIHDVYMKAQQVYSREYEKIEKTVYAVLTQYNTALTKRGGAGVGMIMDNSQDHQQKQYYEVYLKTYKKKLYQHVLTALLHPYSTTMTYMNPLALPYYIPYYYMNERVQFDTEMSAKPLIPSLHPSHLSLITRYLFFAPQHFAMRLPLLDEFSHILQSKQQHQQHQQQPFQLPLGPIFSHQDVNRQHQQHLIALKGLPHLISSIGVNGYDTLTLSAEHYHSKYSLYHHLPTTTTSTTHPNQSQFQSSSSTPTLHTPGPANKRGTKGGNQGVQQQQQQHEQQINPLPPFSTAIFRTAHLHSSSTSPYTPIIPSIVQQPVHHITSTSSGGHKAAPTFANAIQTFSQSRCLHHIIQELLGLPPIVDLGR